MKMDNKNVFCSKKSIFELRDIVIAKMMITDNQVDYFLDLIYKTEINTCTDFIFILLMGAHAGLKIDNFEDLTELLKEDIAKTITLNPLPVKGNFIVKLSLPKEVVYEDGDKFESKLYEEKEIKKISSLTKDLISTLYSYKGQCKRTPKVLYKNTGEIVEYKKHMDYLYETVGLTVFKLQTEKVRRKHRDKGSLDIISMTIRESLSDEEKIKQLESLDPDMMEQLLSEVCYYLGKDLVNSISIRRDKNDD